MSILNKATVYPLWVLEQRNQFVSDTSYIAIDYVNGMVKQHTASDTLEAYRLDLHLCVDFWAHPREYERARRDAMKRVNHHIYCGVFETLDEVRYIIRHGNTATALKLLDELDIKLRQV